MLQIRPQRRAVFAQLQHRNRLREHSQDALQRLDRRPLKSLISDQQEHRTIFVWSAVIRSPQSLTDGDRRQCVAVNTLQRHDRLGQFADVVLFT